MKLTELVELLEELGWKYKLLENPEGGQIVLSERGGRIMGIYPDKESANMLWVQPKLNEPAYVEAQIIQRNDWNTGGERTWFSPEMQYHVADVDSFWDSYHVQAVIDPGSYKFDETEANKFSWGQQVAAMAYQANQKQNFILKKTCEFIQDPLKANLLDTAGMQYTYVGYEATTRIEMSEVNQDMAPLALWTVIQVPAEGEVIIPTYGRAEVVDFFNPTGPSHLTINHGQVRFRIDGAAQHKISLKAVYLVGRIGYIRQGEDGNASLIVRNIQINPSGKYMDVPLHNLQDQGHCIQSYSDNGELGAFGELEYHTPVMEQGAEGEPLKLQDISQMWCYNGKSDVIEKIADYLLGMNS